MAWLLIGAVAWEVLALAVGSAIGRGIRIADAEAEAATPDVDVIVGDLPPAGRHRFPGSGLAPSATRSARSSTIRPLGTPDLSELACRHRLTLEGQAPLPRCSIRPYPRAVVSRRGSR
jgi:hypothetical protein